MVQIPKVCYTEGMRHNPDRVLNLRVPADLRPRLDALADARQTSRHHVAVQALLSGVEGLEAAAPVDDTAPTGWDDGPGWDDVPGWDGDTAAADTTADTTTA